MTESQTFSFTTYIKSTPQVPQDHLSRIDNQLEELAKSCFGIEKVPRQVLLRERVLQTYPQISPEFLRMSYKKGESTDRYRVDVPRFGVYSLDNPTMNIEAGFDWDEGGAFIFRVLEPKLPAVLINQLAMGNEIFRDGSTGTFLRWNNDSLGYKRKPYSMFWPVKVDDSLPRKEKKKKIQENESYVYSLRWNYDNKVLRIRSSFNGIIPTEARKKIIEAKKYFQDSIFLIAERKPEEWTVQVAPRPRIVSDPLLIGVMDDSCFYIDHFDTTPIEDYVRREFTE